MPEALDFMHGWMTSRHEGCVSTMLTESGLSIALPMRHFKGRCDEIDGARPQARHFGVLSVLTSRGVIEAEAGERTAFANLSCWESDLTDTVRSD